MAATPPTKEHVTLPPRRGRVKAQIFKSLTGNLSSAAAIALAKIKWSPPASASASASTSPPSSAYASDGFPDQA